MQNHEQQEPKARNRANSQIFFQQHNNELLKVIAKNKALTPKEIAQLQANFSNYNSKDIVDLFIKEKDNLNSFYKIIDQNSPPIVTAVRNGNTQTVEKLLKAGYDVNTDLGGGCTLLHIAAVEGQIETYNFLIDHGADSNKQTKNGTTARSFLELNHLCNRQKMINELDNKTTPVDPATRTIIFNQTTVQMQEKVNKEKLNDSEDKVLES